MSVVPVSIRFLLTLSTVLWLVGGDPAEASESWRSELYPENWQSLCQHETFLDGHVNAADPIELSRIGLNLGLRR